VGDGVRSNADHHQPPTAILWMPTAGQAKVISTRSAIKEPPPPNLLFDSRPIPVAHRYSRD